MQNTQNISNLRQANDELKEEIALLKASLQEKERLVEELQTAGGVPHTINESYHALFKNMPSGLAHCRMIFKDGVPDDFIYLDVNDAFETLSGLAGVVGKKDSEVVPVIKETDPKLFEIYGTVATAGQAMRTEMYIEALQQWFSVSVYSPEKEHFVAVFDVITERKQTEIAAAESEERFQRLIESSPEAIFIQTEGRFAYLNQAGALLFGAESPEILIGQHVADYYDKAIHANTAKPACRTDLEHRAVPRQEEVTLESNGNTVYLEVSSVPFAFKGNKAGLVFLRDISKRKLAEKERQIALTKYKTLFESFPLGITIADSSGQIVESNRMAEKLLGLAQDQHKERLIDGKEWRIVRMDGSPMPAEEFASVRALNENRIIENEEMGIVKASGKTTWISVTACPLSLSGYGVIIAYSDITERKQARDELRRIEERLHLALESANAGIWEWDLRTNENVWSDELWNIYGLRPHNRKPSYDLWLSTIHPDDVQNASQTIHDAVRRGSELNVEWRVIEKGGKERWLMARGKPVRNIADQVVSYTGITIDITYRKLAELALHEESVRRRILFEQAKDGIVVLDANRKVVEANKSFADMLGYTQEEVLKLHAWDWDINYSTREQMLAMWPEIPSTADTIETRHRRKDGSVYDVEISWNPAEYGKQRQLYCVCRDITDRKQAEAAMRESEHKFKIVADHTYDFESWLDPQGNYIYASPSCERIFGYGSTEFLSDPSLRRRAVHPEDHALFDEHLNAVEAARTQGEIEFRIIRSDGEVRWIEHACQPVFDEQGRYLGIRGSNRDITKRKQVEAALKASTIRFRQALTAAQAGAWEINLLTGEHVWSEELWKLFGLKPGSVMPSMNTWLQMVHPDDRPDAERHVEETMKSKAGFIYEWRMASQNGKERWLISQGTPIVNDDGEPERIVGIVIDITERKLAEKKKKKS